MIPTTVRYNPRLQQAPTMQVAPPAQRQGNNETAQFLSYMEKLVTHLEENGIPNIHHPEVSREESEVIGKRILSLANTCMNYSKHLGLEDENPFNDLVDRLLKEYNWLQIGRVRTLLKDE